MEDRFKAIESTRAGSGYLVSIAIVDTWTPACKTVCRVTRQLQSDDDFRARAAALVRLLNIHGADMGFFDIA